LIRLALVPHESLAEILLSVLQAPKIYQLLAVTSIVIQASAIDMSTQAEARAPTVSNASLDDKSFANRARGFAAGVASGITKLAVGHPFGKLPHLPSPRHGPQNVCFWQILTHSVANHRYHQGAHADVRFSRRSF
jgi:hypothetical protein